MALLGQKDSARTPVVWRGLGYVTVVGGGVCYRGLLAVQYYLQLSVYVREATC